MLRRFIRNNINLVSVILFLVLFCILITVKPAFAFNKDGSPREFGLGYKKKTVLPIWLVTLLLAILAYLAILYYVNFNKFVF